MRKPIKLGEISGLKLLAKPSVLWASVGLWALLALAGNLFLNLSPIRAILGGLIAVLIHWLGEVWHQLGHAWAAAKSGHPMSGIMLWLLLGTSLYPRHEGELPADVHVRRALGGPAASLLLTIVAWIMVLFVQPTSGLARILALFFFYDNLLVFTLGAFLPLPFTDGGTLLKYWGKGRS